MDQNTKRIWVYIVLIIVDYIGVKVPYIFIFTHGSLVMFFATDSYERILANIIKSKGGISNSKRTWLKISVAIMGTALFFFTWDYLAKYIQV
jgi:hypothetical protein